MKISRILVPLDFSPGSEQALDYAVDIAAKLGATVDLLSVIAIPSYGLPELGMGISPAMIDNVVLENQRALEEVAERRGITGQRLIRNGDPRDMILKVAEEVGADLIVMGTHGRRGISRALLGSVAEMVVRTSRVPVLTVRDRKD